MSPANYCVALERWNPSSPIAFLMIEEILRAEGARDEIVIAIVGMLESLLDQLQDATLRADRILDTEDIIDALDGLPIENLPDVVEHCAKLVKEAHAEKGG